MHDLAEDEPARDRVVGEIATGLREGGGLDEDVGHVPAVHEVVQIEGLARQVRYRGSVIEHVADGDRMLAVLFVAGNVVGDRIVDAEHTAFSEFVDHEGGNRLRRGVDAKRGVDSRSHSLGVPAVVRAVAAGVPEGSVEDHRTVAPHAHLHRRMDPAAIPSADRSPHRLDLASADPTRLG